MIQKARIASLQPIQCKIEANKNYYYCTCGYSKKQPFCDGSHKNTSFQPLKFSSVVTTDEALCTCKRTKKAPYCDGIHSRL